MTFKSSYRAYVVQDPVVIFYIKGFAKLRRQCSSPKHFRLKADLAYIQCNGVHSFQVMKKKTEELSES